MKLLYATILMSLATLAHADVVTSNTDQPRGEIHQRPGQLRLVARGCSAGPARTGQLSA
jgi:hypothetical protein